MTIDWIAPGCVGRFPYLWDIGVVHPLDEYRATVRDNGEFVKRFIPSDAVVSLESFIRVEDERHELRVYCGEYIRDKLLGAPIEVVAKELNVVYNGDSDDDDWWLISSSPLVVLSLVF